MAEDVNCMYPIKQYRSNEQHCYYFVNLNRTLLTAVKVEKSYLYNVFTENFYNFFYKTVK